MVPKQVYQLYLCSLYTEQHQSWSEEFQFSFQIAIYCIDLENIAGCAIKLTVLLLKKKLISVS